MDVQYFSSYVTSQNGKLILLSADSTGSIPPQYRVHVRGARGGGGEERGGGAVDSNSNRSAISYRFGCRLILI
jgi:hypothetical protein